MKYKKIVHGPAVSLDSSSKQEQDVFSVKMYKYRILIVVEIAL